jgi:hypothetical protein
MLVFHLLCTLYLALRGVLQLAFGLRTFKKEAHFGLVPFSATVASALAALFLTGCAGYHLGPTNGLEAREKSIQINPFVNQTLQPHLTDAVTFQLHKQFQREGTFQLATHGDADVVLSGSLIKYQRVEVTLASQDILMVRDYRLGLTAHVTARERSTGKVLLDQQVSGFTLIRVGSDLTSSERQALPLLAGDLARNVTALLAEGKW